MKNEEEIKVNPLIEMLYEKYYCEPFKYGEIAFEFEDFKKMFAEYDLINKTLLDASINAMLDTRFEIQNKIIKQLLKIREETK